MLADLVQASNYHLPTERETIMPDSQMSGSETFTHYLFLLYMLKVYDHVILPNLS